MEKRKTRISNNIVAVYKRYREMIHYLFFGGATTLVNWCVYGLLMHFTGFPITGSNSIAWLAAVVFAFIVNKLWVFKSKSWYPPLVLREGSLFLGARIVSGLLEIAGVPILYHLGFNYPLFNIEGFAAKMTVSVIVIILNYIFSKLIIFR